MIELDTLTRGMKTAIKRAWRMVEARSQEWVSTRFPKDIDNLIGSTTLTGFFDSVDRFVITLRVGVDYDDFDTWCGLVETWFREALFTEFTTLKGVCDHLKITVTGGTTDW